MILIRILEIIWRMLVSEKSQEVQISSMSNLKSDGNVLLFVIEEKRTKSFTLFFSVKNILAVMKNRRYAWYIFLFWIVLNHDQ